MKCKYCGIHMSFMDWLSGLNSICTPCQAKIDDQNRTISNEYWKNRKVIVVKK